MIEVLPYRFEECAAWSLFYKALFAGPSHYEQLHTASATQASVKCRFLPARLRHPVPTERRQKLGGDCSAEWLDMMPPGSFADCHVGNDPERLALVLRDQDTEVDVVAFEAALGRATDYTL